ncbi:c-type cytochrome [Chitinophaga rhizophila]|uniref:Cytochrome c n=1 Tax=Chitinophaga rhizophila TaxID=2866212 RepID=A0ABS7G578_9BACT|nr:cytochrome c [Chitinophaga rhizophila]MBW8682812.1 cytochrome c [Chitinophaga rhizophila]
MQLLQNILLITLHLLPAVGFTRPVEDGKRNYEQHCARCHGRDGTKGMFGAKNLQKSSLSDTAILLQIINGKGIMPSFRKRLPADQLNAISTYIKSFRK